MLGNAHFWSQLEKKRAVNGSAAVRGVGFVTIAENRAGAFLERLHCMVGGFATTSSISLFICGENKSIKMRERQSRKRGRERRENHFWDACHQNSSPPAPSHASLFHGPWEMMGINYPRLNEE